MAKSTCGARIKEALDIRGLKPADLCRMTEINKSTMSQYISGLYDPSQVKLDLISRALRVDEAWLMGYDVPMEKTKPTTVPGDELDEMKKKLGALFELVPEERRGLVINMIEAALRSEGLI